MPAVRGKKRKSEQSTASFEEQNVPGMTGHKIPTKAGGPLTDVVEESPSKKRKIAITATQKQALIDNLRLEVTERARKLRAQYSVQAQSLRTRIEIRVNRIPVSLRNAKMGDLLQKYSTDQLRQRHEAIPAAPGPPPVPEKDFLPTRPFLHRAPVAYGSQSTLRVHKRASDEMSGGDKENESEHIEAPKKRPRGAAATAAAQVLSPASSNSRALPRDRHVVAPSPNKSLIARPVSPTKLGTTSLLGNMVEKARSTRAAATTRKATTVSTASSSAGSASSAAATRTRRGAAAAVAAPAKSKAAPPAASKAAPTTATTRATRTTRRASGVSESSDGSTSTVVRTRTAAAKRTVMSTIKKGVSGGTTKKVATKVPPAPSANGGGRVLRKRT